MEGIYKFIILCTLFAVWGCEKRDELNHSEYRSVERIWEYNEREPKKVAVYGYLTSAGQGLILFASKDYAEYSLSAPMRTWMQIWFPVNELGPECLNTYVRIRATVAWRGGLLTLDKVGSVIPLKNDLLECNKNFRYVDYFSKLKEMDESNSRASTNQ